MNKQIGQPCLFLIAATVALFLSPVQAESPPATKPSAPDKQIAVDLGDGVKMEFVWIEPLQLWVGKYEVTNSEYRRFKPAHASHDSQGRPLTSNFIDRYFPPRTAAAKEDSKRTFDGDRQPVVCVDFPAAKEYVAWVNEKCGDKLPAGYRFRLPSEQEFLTYVQCGDGRKYPWGNELYPYGGERKRLPRFGNYQGQECDKRPAQIADFTTVTGYDDGFPITCPVEQSGQNEWGLFGVGGNVWEACTSDIYGAESFGAWRGSSWWGWCGKVENNLQCSWRVNNDGTVQSAIKSLCVPFSPPGSNPKGSDDYVMAAVNLGFRLVLSSQEADRAAELARREAEPRKPSAAAKLPLPGEPLTLDLGGGVGMEFVWIEALKMWVGKYELTNGEYRRLFPHHRDHRGPEGNHPREPVTWMNFDDMKEYATWINWAHGHKLPDGYRARLPSGKEWMTYAQCGDGRLYPWGNELPPKYGNYSGEEVGGGVVGGGARGQSMVGYNDGFPGICPVEKSGQNDWGLFGVGGNLADACATDSTNRAFEAWYGTSFYPHGPAAVDLQCYKGRVPNGGVNRVWMNGFRLVLSR